MTRTISLEQSAGDRPVLTITDEVVAQFAPQRPIWDSLYLWLVETHGAGDECTLHNRTRVGDALMKRLRAAEAARLRKRHHINGAELREAVGWSNVNSGPMETHEGTGARIIGDGLYVLPASRPH